MTTWPDALRFADSRRWLGLIPIARWIEGSTIQFYAFGLTQRGARRRAERKARRLGRL